MTHDPGIPYPGLHPKPRSGEGQACRLEIHRERTHIAHCVPTAEAVGYCAEERLMRLKPWATVLKSVGCIWTSRLKPHIPHLTPARCLYSFSIGWSFT